MRKPTAFIHTVLILLGLVLYATPAMPQEGKTEAPPAPQARNDARYYNLEFVLKELNDDGRVVNSRSYHTGVSSNGKSSSVRTGTKIPVHTNEKGDIAYLDVGVNLDCYVTQETPQGLGLQITAESSSLPSAGAGVGTPTTPIVRQNKWSAMTLVPIGKPTVVFASDNLENKGRMQVEVTATPLR
ncbi:MAG TPA: hypothetical protein VHT28_07315 [Silvibacterium sp.]|jgi:hypothetical protein|nr:hypothetical protein [Silvibacterium sp.]